MSGAGEDVLCYPGFWRSCRGQAQKTPAKRAVGALYSEEVISLRGVLRCENGGIVALEYQTGPLVGFLIEVAGKFPK